MSKINTIFWVTIVLFLSGVSPLLAEDFYLDSPYNKGTMRFEINNDTVWDTDSNFTNGWSLQYHTARYATWDETGAPNFIKWVGKHFPGLSDESSIVRNSHGIGQNMFTPGDLSAEIPSDGDVPYAASMTYSLGWQSYNRQSARTLQVSVGVLGEEAMGEEFQKFVHNDLDMAEDPKGWDTQRDTEPILNIGYQYFGCLGRMGTYTNDWAGQLDLGARASLGNLDTSAELGLMFRFGWNILEGFGTVPAPPGVGIFQSSYIPKPVTASPHSIEVIIGCSGKGILYTIGYDSSLITSDDREVERNNFMATWLLGITYHYNKFFAISFQLQKSTDLLDVDSLPDPGLGKNKTDGDLSYGALLVDFYF